MKKINIIIAFLLIIIINSVISLFYKIYEPFTSSTSTSTNGKNIVLIGDSILKNNVFVPPKKSVEDFIKERNPENGLNNLAINGATIIDVHNQVKKISWDLDKEDTYIFLSAGGNDILENFVFSDNSAKVLDKLFNKYKYLVETLRATMDKSNIYLLDVYIPVDKKIQPYKDIINEWNNRVKDYASDTKNGINGVVDISVIMNDESDFTKDNMGYFVEPSKTGGEKIANKIMDTISS